MGTWNRLIDLRAEVGRGDWKRLAKKHICIYAKPMNTDNKVERVGVLGLGGGGKGRGDGEWRTSVILSTIKKCF